MRRGADIAAWPIGIDERRGCRGEHGGGIARNSYKGGRGKRGGIATGGEREKERGRGEIRQLTVD